MRDRWIIVVLGKEKIEPFAETVELTIRAICRKCTAIIYIEDVRRGQEDLAAHMRECRGNVISVPGDSL